MTMNQAVRQEWKKYEHSIEMARFTNMWKCTIVDKNLSATECHI